MCLSSWSTTFPRAGIVRLLNCSHSGRYVVIFFHDFDSHFLMPNYWASFHMFTSQLDILFYKSACLNCLHILYLGLSVFFLLICRNLLYILRYACFIYWFFFFFFFALLKTTLNLSDLKQRFVLLTVLWLRNFISTRLASLFLLPSCGVWGWRIYSQDSFFTHSSEASDLWLFPVMVIWGWYTS